MSDITAVLDASAVLALLHKEPGAEKVAGYVASGTTAMSAVNYCEVIGKIVDLKKDVLAFVNDMRILGVRIELFDGDQAILAAELRTTTRTLGLSLGDRSCLALAKHLKTVAVTADKAWSALEPYCRVDLIR